MTEIVIWGLEAGKTDPLDERPLYTLARNHAEAWRVMDILHRDHGCHSMRLQFLDGTLPDFAKGLTQ